MITSTKFQAPNNKQIPITEIRKSKQDRFDHLNLELGDYLGFGIWNFVESHITTQGKTIEKTSLA
jgi:hypothetical protein